MKNLEEMELEDTVNIAVAIYVLSVAGVNFARAYAEMKKANRKG
ncbi:hypothetical protein [Companilactobacillus sp.]|nr:hypothetical protein [Companilactobacillus sp.]